MSNVVSFSPRHSRVRSKRLMLKCQPKTPGEATSSKPSLPLIALCEDRPLPPRLLRFLKRLDDEQLQIMEVIVGAMLRGAL